MAGLTNASLYTFKPNGVLGNIPKPLAELTVPDASEMKVWQCPVGKVLQTPVTAEVFTSLHNLIEQEAHALDEKSH